MAREINLRAWNDEYKEFVYATTKELWYGKREFGIEFSVGFSHYPTNDWKITEAIGKRDTRGDLIYEGDIVTENLFWDTTKNDIVYFVVVFVDNGFKIRDKKGRVYEIGLEPTIVGNIFENPELIKA